MIETSDFSKFHRRLLVDSKKLCVISVKLTWKVNSTTRLSLCKKRVICLQWLQHFSERQMIKKEQKSSDRKNSL